MARRTSPVIASLVLALGACRATAAEPRPTDPLGATARTWSDLLTRDEVGATAWTKAHPTWDGRGVVVAVLDTGVDPSVAGLDRLPFGDGPKVIETRDFSGEGHVALRRPRASVDAGVAVLRLDADGDLPAVVVRGYAGLTGVPKAEALWLGAFSEKALAGSAVSDIDRDGRRDGTFAVLVYETPSGPVAVVDHDGDGDLSNETPRRSYDADPRWMTLGRAVDPLVNRAPVAVTLHIDLDLRRVELHFDDGGHGTHCAGIATGWRIEGKDGFDGVAPGAEVMSLKIGHNALSGGATTAGAMASAIRFASRWALERRRPVVINLSYGVGSEREGHSDIDKILDEELGKNPWLAVAVSAGNEGPGLSNIGSPGAATLAWTSAAMLTEQQARTLFGGNPKGRKIFSFSSRGGELDKPDGLAPGTAWSTVPPFSASAVKSGTSMASPQAAGVHALLASAALAEGLPWTNGLAHRALATGARPIAGYSPLDQGAGLIDIGRAWQAYRVEARDAAAKEVAGWRVTTPLPHAPARTAAASYWRVGRYLPEPSEAITFTVQPIMYGTLDEDARERHVDAFTLDADVAWLTPDRRDLVLRGSKAGTLGVRLDAAALAGRPGVHVGRVRARTRGVVAFELPVVVVMPEALEPSTWSQSFATRLAPGDITRVFVQVPPGATAMEATLVARGRQGGAWLLPFDPDGRNVEIWEHQASVEDELTASFERAGEALVPGTWELVVYAPYKNPSVSELTLDVVFRALDAPTKLAYSVSDSGALSTDVALVNRLDQPFRGTIEAAALGIERTKRVDVQTNGTVALEVGPDVGDVVLTLEVDDATWARMTDIAINVVDGGGRVVAQGAFGQRRTTLVLDDGAGRYTLKLTGGLADPDDAKPWSVSLTERHLWRQPRAFEVDLPAGMGRATLLPDVSVAIGLELPAGLPDVPTGFANVAELVLTARDGRRWARLELPLTRR